MMMMIMLTGHKRGPGSSHVTRKDYKYDDDDFSVDNVFITLLLFDGCQTFESLAHQGVSQYKARTAQVV